MKKITIFVPDDTEHLKVSAEFKKDKTLTYWLDTKKYDIFACHHDLGIHPVEDCRVQKTSNKENRYHKKYYNDI